LAQVFWPKSSFAAAVWVSSVTRACVWLACFHSRVHVHNPTMADADIAPKHAQQLFFDNVSPATRLLEKRRQMYEVQDALENQKQRFSKEEENFKKREKQLRDKDLQLQHQLFRFNRFLQDNEAKRRRAETRADEELAQIKQKDEEILDLERQLAASRRQCQELADEVERNMKYEAFLEKVRDQCQEYPEIQDLLTRYETLESANTELLRDQSRAESRAKSLHNHFHSYRKEQEMKTLALTNKMASLSAELDEVVRARQEDESRVDEANQSVSDLSLQFGQILVSVDNLYLRCTTKRKGIKHDQTAGDESEGEPEHEESFKRKKDNAIKQLDVILAYLKDFRGMRDELEGEHYRRARRNTDSRNRQVSIPDTVQLPELKVTFESEAARFGGADRGGSTNSGSDGTTTRDISRRLHSVTGGPSTG